MWLCQAASAFPYWCVYRREGGVTYGVSGGIAPISLLCYQPPRTLCVRSSTGIASARCSSSGIAGVGIATPHVSSRRLVAPASRANLDRCMRLHSRLSSTVGAIPGIGKWPTSSPRRSSTSLMKSPTHLWPSTAVRTSSRPSFNMLGLPCEVSR